MIVENIFLEENVEIGESTSLNNVSIKKNCKISKNCTIFGSREKILEIGENTYVGMECILNGFKGLKIGKNVSFGPRVIVITDSGPNRSEKLQKLYPIVEKEVKIGNDCWIGMNSMIMPGVELGECCIVAAGSFVTDSFPAYSVIGGSPAKLIKNIEKEILD